MAKNTKKSSAKKATSPSPKQPKVVAKAKASAPAKKPAAAPKAAPAKAAPPKASAAPPKAATPVKPAPAKPAPSGSPAPIKAAPAPKPGSLLNPPPAPKSRLTAREPASADDLKMKIGALATSINQIRAVKRSIQRSFWDVGNILVDIRDRKLYVAKGYGSFEAFLEREIELGKTTSLRLARAVQIFVKEPAVAAGMDRVIAVVAAFDGEAEPSATAQARNTSPTSVGLTRSPIPFHKQ